MRGLREVSATALMDAWEKVFSGRPASRQVDSGREFRGPVLDGRWMRGVDDDLLTPDVPMLVGHTRTEGSFYTGPYPPQPTPSTDAELRAAVRGVLDKGAVEVSDALVDRCIAAYRDAAVAEDLAQDSRSVWTEIWGDGLFRYQIVRLSERYAREGTSPQYVMEFVHPVREPYFGTPHEATSPFLFGTYGIPASLFETYGLPENAPLFDDGPLEESVSDTFMDLVASFARNGVPSSATLPCGRSSPWTGPAR